MATDPAGTPQGYALVLPPSEGRPILRELITLEPTIKRPFLDYLAATLAGVSWSTTAEIASASVDINHTQQLCPENGATELTPYIPPGTQPAFLGRITSVVPMLEARAYPPLNAEWVMDVTDPLLPENSGQYQIKLAAGKMRVAKTTGQKPTVRCSIGALARLVTGNAHPEALVAHDDLTLDDPAFLTVLTTLFPPAPNFINEYF